MRVLDAVIASQPDGILFTADDPVALTPTLLQAKALGIKIISIDGDLKDMSVAIANIQSDNVDGGTQAAKHLAQADRRQGRGDGDDELAGRNVSQQRLHGLQGGDRQAPRHHLPRRRNTATTRPPRPPRSSPPRWRRTLTSPGVFTITTNNTEGAATGVREAQRVGKIKIVGFDTSDPIVEDIRKRHRLGRHRAVPRTASASSASR